MKLSLLKQKDSKQEVFEREFLYFYDADEEQRRKHEFADQFVSLCKIMKEKDFKTLVKEPRIAITWWNAV